MSRDLRRYFGLRHLSRPLSLLVTAALANAAIAVAAENDAYANRRPVLGASCPFCPWGALADKLKLAMAPLGYDLRICYNCSGIESVPIVAARRRAPPLTPAQAAISPPPPEGPVDFGITNLDFLVDAYRGAGRYQGSTPAHALRLIATIEDPQYYLVAVRAESFITDLRQIAERRIPARIFIEDSLRSQMILKHYGLTPAFLAEIGGTLTTDRDNFDVIIAFANSLTNAPESNIWYEASQKHNLRFLQLPDDLLRELARASEWEIGATPVRLLRGMDKPITTVRTSGSVIYGRDDMPERFAYDVAKAMDVNKRVLVYSILPFAYLPENVWKAREVPLHPGAARYYREVGYLRQGPSTP